MSDDFTSRLGWVRPEKPDPRDALMGSALRHLGTSSSWWTRYFNWLFRHRKPKPPAPPTTVVRWFDPNQLDQGNTPHCVGFSAAQFLNTDPIRDNCDNATGHELYYHCKQLDGEPMQENGSSVHTGAKVLQKRGRIGTYVWARSVDEIKRWVTAHGPVMVGTDWLDGMFTPDREGFVSVTGPVAGGHAYLLVGYEPAGDVFTFQNSWGKGWGADGYFKVRVKDWAPLFDGTAEACATTELPLGLVRP